jgi:hypothetical protein
MFIGKALDTAMQQVSGKRPSFAGSFDIRSISGEESAPEIHRSLDQQ